MSHVRQQQTNAISKTIVNVFGFLLGTPEDVATLFTASVSPSASQLPAGRTQVTTLEAGILPLHFTPLPVKAAVT